MTVAEIDALLYSAEHPIEALRRAIRIPALSRDWQGSMQALLAAAEAGGTTGNAGLGPGASAPPAWPGFRPVVIVASGEESADVRSFEFAAEDGSPLPPARPGQHILLRMRPNPDAPAVTRNYSLCGPPGTPNYRIGVKYERGLASGFLHQFVRAGRRLEVSAPRGSFMLAAGAAPVVLISAGVGVTRCWRCCMVRPAATRSPPGRSGGCTQPAIGRTILLLRRRPICSWRSVRRIAA